MAAEAPERVRELPWSEQIVWACANGSDECLDRISGILSPKSLTNRERVAVVLAALRAERKAAATLFAVDDDGFLAELLHSEDSDVDAFRWILASFGEAKLFRALVPAAGRSEFLVRAAKRNQASHLQQISRLFRSLKSTVSQEDARRYRECAWDALQEALFAGSVVAADTLMTDRGFLNGVTVVRGRRDNDGPPIMHPDEIAETLIALKKKESFDWVLKRWNDVIFQLDNDKLCLKALCLLYGRAYFS